jgi:polysaccharide export outer membrane protein
MKIGFPHVFRFLLLITAVTFISSCASRKNLVYFQDNNQAKNSDSLRKYSLEYRPGDMLAISVSAFDMEAARPFNLPVVTFNSASKGVTNTQDQQGYLIDADGMIDFPVLGSIKLAGMNHAEAIAFLKEKIKGYLMNPIINLRLLNFKITVLGDVKNSGTFTVPDEKITLPEALGLAGDLDITGLRKNVLVIREVNGFRTYTNVDLTTRDVFNSPVYYLCQNDVVYVAPNRSKVNSSVYNSTSTETLISLASLLITIVTLIEIK